MEELEYQEWFRVIFIYYLINTAQEANELDTIKTRPF